MNNKLIYNKALVSVIIPTYNRADYLKIAIDSVLEQTYKNFELLILDNHSSDHTQEIISSYFDERIKSVRHLTNIGGVANWLYGIHWASGEYFSVLGDDDFYRHNFLESRVKAFASFPDVVAVFSDHETCDQAGIIKNNISVQIENETTKFAKKSLLGVINEGRWQVGSTLFRRHEIVKIWDECIRAGKAFDTAVTVQIALHHSAAWIPSGGLIYRQHLQQDSHTGGRGILIGYVNAFIEPYLFENHQKCEASLKDGAWWAVDVLARTSYNEKKILVARKLFILAVLLKPLNIRSWIRMIRSFLSITRN